MNPLIAQRIERELACGILSRTTSFRLVVSGEIGPIEMDRLISKLELDRAILRQSETLLALRKGWWFT